MGGQRPKVAKLDAVATLAASQWGVVARRQLLDAGVSADRVKRHLADGRLVRMHRGVYGYGHTALRPQAYALAAVLACGDGAVLAIRSAGGAWGIHSSSRARHEVITPHAGGRGLRSVDVYRYALAPQDRTVHDGIPITSVARTCLDLASRTNAKRLDRALHRAEELRLFDLRAFDDATNAWRHGFEVDLAWPGVIVELDGYAFHKSRASFEADRRRIATLAARGYTVLPFTWYQLKDEPGWVARTIAEALALSRSRWACADGAANGPAWAS
jgi:very-short-patch-repair endonuclease